MKKNIQGSLIKSIIFSMLFVFNVSLIHADNETENSFIGVEIINEDTYQPIDENVSENLENKEMGGDPMVAPRSKARSAGGPRWENNGGVKSFYDADGTLMYQHGSKYVIDVSEHNGEINWDEVKASGVDGAILRVGWGYLGEDAQFARNIAECNRLGIPYGIYLYSYAYDANFAYAEAEGTATMLANASVNLSYPIYYDIENFSPWNDNGTTRRPPTSVSEYESIIGTYISRMSQLGYNGNVHVYSYRSYLQSVLNSASILPYVSWVAAYTNTLGFENSYYVGEQGWQYTSDGYVSGISGRVDLNCFSNQLYGGVATIIPDIIKSNINAQGLQLNGAYLTGFEVGSNSNNIINALSSIGNTIIYNLDGTVANGAVLATGQKIIIDIPGHGNFTLQVIIRGDVNGDGKISALDYVKVRNKLDGNKNLNEYEAQGADTNHDGQVKALDYVKIRNHLDGKSVIEQK